MPDECRRAITHLKSKGLRKFCIFVICLYIRPWCTSTNPIHASKNDLEFIKILSMCVDVDEGLRQVALEKFNNHLWY